MHERTQPIPGCLRSPGSQILLLCPSLRGKRLHGSVSAVRLDRQTYGFQIIVLGPISEWLRAWARQSLITRLLLLTLDVCDSTQWWYEGQKVTSVSSLTQVLQCFSYSYFSWGFLLFCHFYFFSTIMSFTISWQLTCRFCLMIQNIITK